MESFQDFLNRINSFEKRELALGEGYFQRSGTIPLKVDENNEFRSFYGDTVVFNLSDDAKQILNHMVDELYQAAPECFCSRLDSNTFHLTLHDLSNSNRLEDIAVEMFNNELKIIDLLNQIDFDQITMKSHFIFNMVNTSLVMGFYPTNEIDYDKIMKLYSVFDEIKPLTYPFTPHVTLAYYAINGFDEDSKRRLESIVNELNKKDIEIELNISKLYYQKFVSMNEYYDIYNIK